MKYLFAAILTIATITSSGQNWDAKVTTGVISVQQQDYPKAISALREALKHEDELKEKNVVKAYYNLADALIRESQFQQSQEGENVDRKYAEYIFEAADLLVKAKNLPDDEHRLKSQINIRINSLFNSLLMSVVQLTNSVAAVEPEGKAPYLQEMLRVCSAMVRLKPDHYMAYDYRGQTHLSKKDSSKAHSDLSNAIELYEKDAPDGPDAMAGYMYYRTALIELYGYKNRQKALELLNAGLVKIDSDRKEIENAAGKSEDFKKDVLEKFKTTEKDIKLFRLDLLLNSPTLSESELLELKNGMTDFPENLNVRLAYAQRIQKSEPQVAIEIYDQVLALEPNNVTALFNAGVLYYNKAADLSSKLSEVSNPAKDDEAMVAELFRQGIPYFEKAHSLGETNSKQVLFTIGRFLGDEALIEKYK